MSRFVDYFFISGYDHTKGRSGNHRESKSQVIQRFPEKVNATDATYMCQRENKFFNSHFNLKIFVDSVESSISGLAWDPLQSWHRYVLSA